VTFIIAEIGINHDGDLSKAVALTRAAAAAGVDAVKCQYFSAARQARCDLDLLKTLLPLEMSFGQLRHLQDVCAEVNVEFVVTPFCYNTIRELRALGPHRLKIGSGQVKDDEMMRQVVNFDIPCMVSNGMATDAALESALQWFPPENTTILYCVSMYPTPDDAIDLSQIARLRQRFGKPVGFSCHSPSMWPSVAAAAMGATVIEKHVSLDVASPGPDHSSSLPVGILAHWVKQIRAVSP